jgi:urea transport system substrate-binding protein
MVYLWKQAVEKAKTADHLEKVKAAAYGQSFDAPEGKVKDDGLFQIVYETKDALQPIPWNQFLAETKGYACDWLNPSKGGKYKLT